MEVCLLPEGECRRVFRGMVMLTSGDAHIWMEVIPFPESDGRRVFYSMEQISSERKSFCSLLGRLISMHQSLCLFD